MSARPELRVVTPAGGDDVGVLLAEVAKGDSSSFERLYDAMSAQVYGLARRVIRDPDRAEDVAQDVFVEVWRKAATFDRARGTAKTWILTITHRRAVDAVRRAETSRKYEAQVLPDEVDATAPGEAMLDREERDAVRDCLDSLTELQQESIRLAYYQGYTYNQVATLLDKPLPTIKTRMRDGLIRLRDCMGLQFGEVYR
jgi:RNA polymerase sigma-70 factor, ECF subfamily